MKFWAIGDSYVDPHEYPIRGKKWASIMMRNLKSDKYFIFGNGGLSPANEYVRIDSTGRLLVGTDDGWGSSVKLHLASTGNTYATITSGTSHNSVLAFSDDGTERGSIDYDHHHAEGFIKLNALRIMMNKLKQS